MVFTDTLIREAPVGTVTMSEYSSPVSVAFDLQRSAVEGTHEAIENTVEAQKQFSHAVVDGFGPARDASERSADLFRTSVDSYFDAVESVLPAGSGIEEVREALHDQLDAVEESQLDAIDQFEEGLNEGADSTAEFLDEFLAALDEQVATLLETHEDLESQTVDSLEQLEESIDELQAEMEAHGEDLQEQLEAQADAISEQLEEVSRSVQDAAETTELTA